MGEGMRSATQILRHFSLKTAIPIRYVTGVGAICELAPGQGICYFVWALSLGKI